MLIDELLQDPSYTIKSIAYIKLEHRKDFSWKKLLYWWFRNFIYTHNKLIKHDLAKTKNELQPQLNIRNSNISPLPSVFVCHYLLYFLCLQIATFFFIIPWVIFLYCTKQKQNWLSQLYRQYGKIINIRFY